MKAMKRIFLGLTLCLVVLFGAIAAVPYLFKDQLIDQTKILINKNINATVDFSTVSLSVFRHFPDLTLALNDFTLTGLQDFQDLRLAYAREAALTLDLLSVLQKKPIKVKNVDLNQPDIHFMVLPDGRANYNIAKTTPAGQDSLKEATPLTFKIELDNYTIEGGKIIYDDESLDTYVEAKGIEHYGKGAFTRTIFDLNTSTHVDDLLVRYGNITYLNKAKADLEAILTIDQSTNTYRLKDNLLSLNALQLEGNGAVQMKGNNFIIDLLIEAPSNDFKNLLSIVPGAYLEGYEAVKAEGDFALDAKIEGTYNATNQLRPAIAANLKVKGANIQYPDLPLGISDIRAQASINSPGNDLDQLQVDVADFNLQIGSNPFGGRLQLRHPISNPSLDTRIKGSLDLNELAQAFPIKGMEQLQGLIVADITARTSMKEIESGNFEEVNMKGSLQANNFIYQSKNYPVIAIPKVLMDFSPRFVGINQIEATLGKSDWKGSGRIDNILAYFSPKKTLKGNLLLKSNYFLVDEWLPTSSSSNGEPTAGQLDTAMNTSVIFDRFDFTTDLSAQQIDYDRYTIRDAKIKGQFKPNQFSIQSASAKIDESDLQLSGEIQNVFDYAFNEETLRGNIQLNSNYLNLNHFMELLDESGHSESNPETSNQERMESGILLVPANMNLTIRATVKDLLYTNMNIKNLEGELKVAEKAVELRDLKGETLGGKAIFSGRYDTENPAEPSYGMKLDLNRLRFQESFQTLNTFQKLAPVGQFLEGIFNSSLSLNGTLGKGMMPNLNTLDAKGFLETLNGTIKKYPPLEKLGEKLRIIELQKAIDLANTKNWIEIINGAVEVKPFDLTVEDIPLTIAGRHGLNMEMNYDIKAAIPRDKLDNNVLTNALGESLDIVKQQAQTLGINIERSETIHLLIHLGGQIKNPTFTFSLLGADGKTSLKDAINQSAERELNKQKERLEETLESEKERLSKKAKSAVDSAKSVLAQQADSLKKKAGNKIDSLLKNKADSLLKDPARKVLDTLLKKKEIEKLKKELEEFNPFKKKTEKKGSGGLTLTSGCFKANFMIVIPEINRHDTRNPLFSHVDPINSIHGGHG